MIENRLGFDFYNRDVLEVAPELVGKTLVRVYNDGSVLRANITEVESYRGIEDLACHASKGRTARTEVMFGQAGRVYVYLIYGMYWMLNVVTGERENPQAILIRGIESCYGPGRLTKKMAISKDFYGEDLVESPRLWIESNNYNFKIITAPRIGVEYAGEVWSSKPWRFYTKDIK